MLYSIPLEQMTTSEKLQAIEEIWSSLDQLSEDIPSPQWHGRVLNARKKRIAEGSSQFWILKKQSRLYAIS